jgi:hypothetical protein
MNKAAKSIFSIFLVAAAVSLVMSSCRKKDEEDNDTGAATDNAFAESSFNDLSAIGDQASTGSLTSYRSGDDGSLLSACATITFNNATSSDNDTLTVDFGTTNCLCSDGRYRRGKVIITYTGGMLYRDSGIVVNFAPTNYFVNDHQILGTKTVTNRGHIGGQLTWDIVVSGSIIKPNNGGTITWNSTRQRKLLAGETTYNGPINWSIAKVGVTGSANGTTANGDSYSANIVSQLIRDFSCTANRRHIVQGKLDFTPGNKPTRHIDFGNGACDDIAVVTIGNNTYTVHMN